MAVQPHPHRSTWTDERLDDLADSMRAGFSRIDGRFDQVDARFNHLESRIDGLQKTLIIGLFGLTGTLVAAIVAGVTAVITLS